MSLGLVRPRIRKAERHHAVGEASSALGPGKLPRAPGTILGSLGIQERNGINGFFFGVMMIGSAPGTPPRMSQPRQSLWFQTMKDLLDDHAAQANACGTATPPAAQTSRWSAQQTWAIAFCSETVRLQASQFPSSSLPAP